MAKKSKKSAAGSAKKKAKIRKTLSVVISVIVLVLAIAWYFGGKPVVEVGAEGVTLVQTEEPLAAHIPEILSGEYPPEVEYAEGQGIPSPETPEQKSTVPEPVEGQAV